MVLTMKHLLFAFVSMCVHHVAVVTAQDKTIEWRIRTYEDMTANVGDTYTFNWSFVHNVLIHPNGECTDDNGISVGESSGTSYTFTEADAGSDVTFVCTIPGHCQAGQILTVSVRAIDEDAPKTYETLWDLPYEAPADITSADFKVGDMLKFSWASIHNVFKMAEIDSCNFDGATVLGRESPVTYTITKDDAGKQISFACNIPGHCDALNQIITINVVGVDGEEEAPDVDGEEEAPDVAVTDESEQSVETTVIEWIIKQYDDIDAKVGDTLQFNYGPFHNVYIHPSGTCDATDSTILGANNEGGVTYTFTEDDAGTTVTFVCQVQGHCPAGQILNVNVAQLLVDPVTTAPISPAPISSAPISPAPVVDPTPTPTVAATDEPEPSVETTVIDWVIKQYEDMEANVGDTLQFNYQPFHNVYIHPSGTCDGTNSIEIGGLQDSGATYTFTEDDAGTTITFVCQVQGHCSAGQILNVIVAPVLVDPVTTAPISPAPVVDPTPTPTVAATDEPEPSVETTVIDWVIKQYEDMEANVGDTLQFNYAPFHNVYIHPSGTCDGTDSIEIGGLQDSGATYTFTEDDAGTTVTFVCQVQGHCSAGQILNVSVASNEPVTSPPETGGGGFAVCFSGNTLVQDVLGKGSILMSDLKIGDQVKTVINKGEESYETVYSFGHYNPKQVGEFLQITTTIMNNKKSNMIEMSKDHLILLSNSGNDKFVPASTLKIGDELVTTADGTAVVSRIKSVKRQGVYAPFTTSGTIAVSNGGIVASSFVTLQEGKDTITINGYETGISAHTAAYLFETIHRMAYKLGMTDVEESYSTDGISRWVEMPRTFFLTLLNDHSTLIQTMILIPSFTLLTILRVVEDYNYNILFSVVVAVLLHQKKKKKSVIV